MSNEGALRHRSNRTSDESNESNESNERPAQTVSSPFPALTELRLVLLGRTGAGKSATGNTILGEDRFHAEVSMSSVTKECRRERGTVEGRKLVLVDTPDFIDSDQTLEEIQSCLDLSSPGPHAFLLVIPIERYTEEQQRTVEMILEMFNEDIDRHSILIFSHADRLRGESIGKFILRQNPKVRGLVKRFGRRFVAFDNTNPTNREQVSRLLQKVDELLIMNKNCHFTNEVTEAMQEAQKIIEEKREAERMKKIKNEVKKLSDVHWAAFMAAVNEEKEEIERKRKHIQGRIDWIESDIMKEEQNVQPIPQRLKRYKASLNRELENMRRLEERRMEEERQRIKRKEQEKKDLKIWIQEEEQRRLSEGGPKNLLFSFFSKKKHVFLLGLVVGFAIALVVFVLWSEKNRTEQSNAQPSSWLSLIKNFYNF